MNYSLQQLVLALLLVTQALLAQHADTASLAAEGPAVNHDPVSVFTTPFQEDAKKAWESSFSIAAVLPGDQVYLQPTLAMDLNWLHLEARYNYEALDTASAWIGYNFSFGEKLSIAFTPMMGAVFGETKGFAPGYEISAKWWKLEFYKEGEFLIDSVAKNGNFYYSWAEFRLALVEWARVGMVVQRTKLYQTEFDTQRGLMASFSFRNLDLNAYLFNPDKDPFWVFSVRIAF
jgi:hypothetical protein